MSQALLCLWLLGRLKPGAFGRDFGAQGQLSGPGPNFESQVSIRPQRVGTHLAQGLAAVVWSDRARLEGMERGDEPFLRIRLSSGEKSAEKI